MFNLVMKKQNRLIVKLLGMLFIMMFVISVSIFILASGLQRKERHHDLAKHKQFKLTIPFDSNKSCPGRGVIIQYGVDTNDDGLPQKSEWQKGKKEIICR
jgi:hypothetical protein